MTPAGALILLLHRAEAQGWAGPDPYDGLASPLGALVRPLGAPARFALSQLVLRYPYIRDLARPKQTMNPKALALFLGAAGQGRSLTGERAGTLLTDQLLDRLARGAVPAGDARGWSYPFPWQSRFFWAPAGTPNSVVTAIVGWHLLDCAEELGDARAHQLGLAAARFLAFNMNCTTAGRGEALSYTPRDSTKIINISALGARLLARASQMTGSPWQRELAARFVRFILAAQRQNGSWPYGVGPAESWEDSFHTGYVLESLIQAQSHGITVPERAVMRGFEAYRRFFGAEGEARLFPRADSPLDAHSAAQGVLTYAVLARWGRADAATQRSAREAALRIAKWALEELWVDDPGFFAYRIERGRRDEREFTRWVSGWMALAMATAARLEMDQIATDAEDSVEPAPVTVDAPEPAEVR
jgi:hypothetical protein